MTARPDTAWLWGAWIAHRGLHDKTCGVVENTRAACRAAVTAGYPIELDVRLSADGEAMVFHDAALERLTAATGPLAARRAEALAALTVTGAGETIPRLGEILALVAGRVPLLLDLKTADGSAPPGALEARVTALLETYAGPAAVQSFCPHTVAWFAAQAPDLARGFLSATTLDPEDASGASARERFFRRHLLAALPARPHFFGYEAAGLTQWGPRMARAAGWPVLAWTVRSAAQAQGLAADGFIFEGFRPDGR